MFYKVIAAIGFLMCFIAVGGAEGTMHLADCIAIGAVGAPAMVYGMNKLGLFE